MFAKLNFLLLDLELSWPEMEMTFKRSSQHVEHGDRKQQRKKRRSQEEMKRGKKCESEKNDRKQNNFHGFAFLIALHLQVGTIVGLKSGIVITEMQILHLLIQQ